MFMTVVKKLSITACNIGISVFTVMVGERDLYLVILVSVYLLLGLGRELRSIRRPPAPEGEK